MVVFTICSRNFLGYSETLYASLKRHHPGATFYLILCDESEGLDPHAFPYPIVTMDQLGISNLETMQSRYNITELNTSLKPFAFLYIFDNHPGEEVVYLDPDILIASPMQEIEDLFGGGADCILTPHITEPAEFADMNDYKFITYGIYNLGFCALRDTTQTRRLVAWWGRRLERDCVIDLARGIFVDQKWADYFPAFIEKTAVLRHPGYNVAYWNLSQRKLTRTELGWCVNGLPLRFFHFSGNRIEDLETFTRHSGQFNLRNTPLLTDLLTEYREQIYRCGHKYYSGFSYAFSWSGSSGHNEHTPESYRRQRQGDSVPHLPLLRSRSLDEFQRDRAHNGRSVAARRWIEAEAIPNNEPFTCDGYCTICRSERTFQVSQMYASRTLEDGRIIPNWREHLNCLTCGVVNRTRGALHILDQEFRFDATARVYITEQVTPLFRRLRERWPTLTGSEYLSAELKSGTERDGIRHEDVQALSFPDRSFDLIMSYDVLEHVPFRQKAFEELFRCLAPGGRLFFTVPFSFNNAEEVVRAVVHEDGTLEHLLEPEYHGNPVDMEGGSLCFRYFGWSVVRHLEEAGFTNAEVLSYWSDILLHYGDPQFVITATRPRAS